MWFGVQRLACRDSMQDISLKLREFVEHEMRSCSMDIGGITPEYVCMMWGGSAAVEEIREAMTKINGPNNYAPADLQD